MAAAFGLTGLTGACGRSDSGRALNANIVANTLGIHVPYLAALMEGLSESPGYAAPDVKRISKLETITQSVLTGSAEIGTADAISTLRAVEAGASLKIIGNCFMNTSLVFVANAEQVPEDEALLSSNATVAVNSQGDFTHVMLIEPLRKRGIDVEKVNVISMGGSGTRLRALLAGKISAAPIHFDQAAKIIGSGQFRILIEPWVEFDNFLGEVWMANDRWLRDEANQRIAVDLMKSVIECFRRSHRDGDWYATAYREYGTDPKMAIAKDAEIEETRRTIANTIEGWPVDMRHDPEIYRELIPLYVEAGALRGASGLLQCVDTRFVEQALAELA